MIVVLKQNSDKERVERLMQHFTDMGLRINYSEGEDTTILGLMGDTTRTKVTLWRMMWSSAYSA